MDFAKIRTILIAEEGYSRKVYPDSSGNLTIGVGFNTAAHGIPRIKAETMAWTDDQVEAQLQSDVNSVSSSLFTRLVWLKGKPDPIQSAIICMGYQLGIQGVCAFLNTLRLIQEGEYEDAADNMLFSHWATRQSPKRALRMSEIIRNQKYLPWHDEECARILAEAGVADA